MKNKDEGAECLETPVKKLTLNLDDKFVRAIGPHIPDKVKPFKIYDAFALRKGSDYVLGGDTVSLLEGNGRQMSVHGVLFQSKLLPCTKPTEDVTIDEQLMLGLTFEKR